MGCLRLRGPARAIDVEKNIYDQSWLLRSHSHLHWEAFRHCQAQKQSIVNHISNVPWAEPFLLKVGLLAGSPSDACEHTWKEGVAHN